MEERILERYSEAILEEARERYQILVDEIKPLDGFESYIYEFNHDQGPAILRIAHSLRRTPDLIRGELDWINYLFDGSASVSRPIPSQPGNLVEEIQDGQGGFFLATAFERADGGPHQKGGWTPEFLFNYGRMLGQIHRLSRDYQPGKPSWKRPEWDDPIMLEIEQYLPENDQLVKKNYAVLRDMIRDLHRDGSCYGLIHQDAHRGNFFVTDEGKITLFDFDDCVYSWFVNDIALVLFYAAMGQDNQGEFIDMFLKDFLPGYLNEVELDPVWYREIPRFCKLREIDLYAVLHRSFDVENLDDPWVKWYLDGRKEKLEKNIPFLDFDFNALAKKGLNSLD